MQKSLNFLRKMIIQEYAKKQLIISRKMLKESPGPINLKKSRRDKEQEDLYDSYLLVFDALNKNHEALKKLMEADKLLSKYEENPRVQKVLTAISNAIKNDLSPVIDRFSVMVRVLKVLALNK